MAIGDNPNELFDIVNEKDQVVGRAKREEVHRNKKLIHRSIGVIIFNKKNEIFLQQRSKNKDLDPLKWTISCSGHVLSGDTYKTTAHRELKEELGLDLKIIQIAKYLSRDPSETEMVCLYRGYSEGPFILNRNEIKNGRFFSLYELMGRVKKGTIELNFSAKTALYKTGWVDKILFLE